MLLNDRLVGSFGVVAPGDRELIVKVAVAAVRNGFGVVPVLDDCSGYACALTTAAAKRDPDHSCYHVLTEDTKTRPAFQRLTKDGKTCNLAVDLGASNLGVTSEVDSWWVGPEISPTLRMPDNALLYVFDVTDAEMIPAGMQTTGSLLMPPSINDGNAVELIGQLNYLTDNKETEEMSIPADLWNSAREDEVNARIEGLETRIEGLEKTSIRLQEALVVALTTLKELRDKE